MERARAELFALWREIWLLTTSIAVLEWDEENGMPAGAAPHRSEQLGLLAGFIHDRLVQPRLRDLVDELAGDPQAEAARPLIDRALRLPRALVLEEKHAAVMAQQAWLEARERGAFSSSKFPAALARVVELKRQVSRCLTDDGADPWACHLREYEPGASAASIVALLEELGRALTVRVHAAHSSSSTSARHPLRVPLDPDARGRVLALCTELFGYDGARGAFGENPHPFCATLGPDDVRIALRSFAGSEPLDDLLGYAVHEIGHALYEQGVPRDLVATPGGELRSLSLHESQSRLWENEVGKSRALWTHLLPRLAHEVPALHAAGVDDVVASLHRAEPGAVRVGSDPVTYNLHILVRVELERALIGGSVTVDDLPAAWSAGYERHLGVRPQNDVEGVLQDGHWAAGMFGYFPTYAVGNLVAAQLMAAARRDVPSLDDAFARGDVGTLRDWLRVRVWRRAGLATLDDVVTDATGEPLGNAAFLAGLAHA